MRKKLTIIIIAIAYLIIFSQMILGQTYYPRTYPNGLTITSNSNFTGGNYIINGGDFVINSGVTLTINNTTTINVVNGNIRINGNITTSNVVVTLKLIADKDILVKNTINVKSANGVTGTNGAPGDNGTTGGDGKTSDLTITSKYGNIVLESDVSLNSGVGGKGGNGGASWAILFKGWEHGGNGGRGGLGGAGGLIKITAEKGIVEVKKKISSLGGKGGDGGTGGKDNSVVGGPGDGGDGYTGGDGGTIELVGQDVKFYSDTILDCSPGAGGARGAGGAGGDFGSSGSPGIPGVPGGDGSVKVVGGEIFYNSSKTNNLTSVIIKPSSTPKSAYYDNESPYKPAEIIFSEFYDSIKKTYYTSVKKPQIKIKVPQDKGYEYGGNDYISGIYKFEVYKNGTYMNTGIYNDSLNIGGYFSFTLDPKDYNKALNLTVKTVDKNNKGVYSTGTDYSTGLTLYIDTVAPLVPSLSGVNVVDRAVTFNWQNSTDVSGIKGYRLWINDVELANLVTGTSYTYQGDYNELITLKIAVVDKVGNESAQAQVSAHTYPQSSAIQSINTSGNNSVGYQAQVNFISRGTKATNYQIRCFDTQNLSSPIFDQKFTFNTPENQINTIYVSGLSAHRSYKFEIRTESSGKYSDWVTYSEIITIHNNPPTKAVLSTPDNNEYINLAKIDNFKLIAEKSTDPDSDSLWYRFYLDGVESEKCWAVGNEVTYSSSSLNLIDGTHEWYVRTFDGYTSVDSIKREFIVDLTPPTRPMFTINKTKVNERNVLLTSITSNSDYAKLEIWSDVDNQIIEIDPNNTYTFTLPDIEGKQWLHLRAKDVAGNVSSSSYQIDLIYDKTPPKQPTNLTVRGEINSINVTWDDAIDTVPQQGIETSGVEKYLIRYRKPEIDEWTEKSVSSTNYTITGIGENEQHEIQVAAVDYAGNQGQWSSSIYGYSLPSIAILDVQDISWEKIGDEYKHFVDFQVDPKNSAQYKIIRKDLSNGLEQETEWVASSNLTYRDYVLPPHKYQYKIRTCNSASVEETVESEWFEVSVPNHLPEAPINTAASFINQIQPVLDCQLSFDIDGHGLTYYYLVEEEDATGQRTQLVYWEVANESTNYYKPSFALKNGYTYYYRVGVDDGYSMDAGVPQVISVETSFTIDLTPPEIEMILPEEIKEKILAKEFVSDATVTVTAQDLNSIINNGAYSGLKKISYYWNDNTSSVEINSGDLIEIPHGVNTLYIIAEDNVGNISLPESLIFKVDKTSPLISNFVLQGMEVQGSKYTANVYELMAVFDLKDEETVIETINYCILTEDELASVNALSDDRWHAIEVKDGIENHYEVFLPHDLEDGVRYYLALKARNSVGRETLAVSEAITIDSSGPVITFTDSEGTVPERYELSDLDDLTIKADAVDAGSGVKSLEFGLSEKPEESSVNNWYQSINEILNLAVNDGSELYLIAKAIDNLDQISIAVSVPILIDTTPPVIEKLIGGEQIPGTDQYLTQWDPTYLKVYWQIKDEIDLKQIRYAIGTTNSGRDISRQMPGNNDGWLVITECVKEKNFVIDDLNLADGDYFVTIEVKNTVGLLNSYTSNRIEIDTTLPAKPIIKDDGICTSKKELHFTVSFSETELISHKYYYQILNNAGEIVLNDLELANPDGLPDVSVTIDESAGIIFENGTTYYVVLGEKIETGFNPVAYSDGILIDWTLPEFMFYADGDYFAEDNVFLSWDAVDPESKIKEYYLKVGTSRGGDELSAGWLSLGIKNSIAIRDLEFSDGGLYFATVKAINRAGVESVVMGDGFRIDTSPPPIPRVLTESDYTTNLDTLSASWTWSEPDLGSGVVAYYYDYLTVRDTRYADWKPVESITGDPLATVITLTDLSLVNGTTYYIAIKAINGAGLESVGFSGGIMADTEAPITPIIDDLMYSQDFNDQLTAKFYSRDEQSGLTGFEYAIGTLDNETAVTNWQVINNWEETVSGLSLEEGEVYFFTALAKDNAGLYSATSRSDGVLIDMQRPKIENLQAQGEYTDNAEELFFVWEATPSYAPIVEYEYCLSNEPNPAVYNWQVTTQQQILLTAVDMIGKPAFVNGQIYYFFIRARDAANKVSEIATTNIGIDSTPPTRPIIHSESEYQGQELILSWGSQDPETGIARYRYGIGTVRGEVDVSGEWIVLEENDETVQLVVNNLALKHNQRYYLSVQAQNNAGKWSEVGNDNGFLIDLTPPEVVEVVGPGEYLTNKSTIANITFTAQEGEVGIKAYRYQIISEAEKDQVTTLNGAIIPINLQNGISKNVTIGFTADDLTLEEAEKYYIAVQAQNVLNLWSEVGFTPIPFIVDTISPEVSFNLGEQEMVKNNEDIDVKWNTNEIGKLYYRIKHPDGKFSPAEGYLSKEITNVGEQILIFEQTEIGIYDLILYCTDLAENKSAEIIQKIRMNAPPIIQVGIPRSIYQGRILSLDQSDFLCTDEDGTVEVYTWDFGDGDEVYISSEPSIAHIYTKTGEYSVTLTATDNDGGETTATLIVSVTTTLEGELALDEVWTGKIELKGDIIVPVGITLTIKSGTEIIVPLDSGLEVDGKILSGETGEKVRFTVDSSTGSSGPDSWKGIYLSPESTGSTFINTLIEYASRGLILNKQDIVIEDSILRENGIGIHMEQSRITIQKCSFDNNLFYGIKEEGNCTPIINDNIFTGNGLAPYYHNQETILTVEEVNNLLGSGNQ